MQAHDGWTRSRKGVMGSGAGGNFTASFSDLFGNLTASTQFRRKRRELLNCGRWRWHIGTVARNKSQRSQRLGKVSLWVLPDCAYAFETHNKTWLGMRGEQLTTDPRAITEFNRFRLHPADFETPADAVPPAGISGQATLTP